MIDLITGIACVSLVAVGLIGLQIVSKRRVESQSQVAIITVRAITLGGASELELTPEQAEEADLERAYARMPLRWFLTGSRRSFFSPLVLSIITAVVWIPGVLLFPAYFEGYISGAAMLSVSYLAWVFIMYTPPILTLVVTANHIVDWVWLRMKWGVRL
jgi:hypothetical protein